MSDKTLQTILKDCFWEYNFSKEDIVKLAKSQNIAEKKFLFEKILANSTMLIKSMEIFDKNNLKELIESYQIPMFNKDYLSRRLNMLEFYFLNKPLTINELKWVT